MKLYYSPGACSMSPHIVLEESGLRYETERVNLKTKATETGADFNAINLRGYVPALLLDDGQLLTEGPAIVQYVADRVPEKKLAPAWGSFERYRLQEWLTFTGTELHKNFSPVYVPTSPPEWKAVARALLERRLDAAGRLLGDRAYTVGDAFSVADAYLFTVTNWSRVLGHDLSRFARIEALRARVAERPSVQAAMKAEGLLK